MTTVALNSVGQTGDSDKNLAPGASSSSEVNRSRRFVPIQSSLIVAVSANSRYSMVVWPGKQHPFKLCTFWYLDDITLGATCVSTTPHWKWWNQQQRHQHVTVLPSSGTDCGTGEYRRNTYVPLLLQTGGQADSRAEWAELKRLTQTEPLRSSRPRCRIYQWMVFEGRQLNSYSLYSVK